MNKLKQVDTYGETTKKFQIKMETEVPQKPTLPTSTALRSYIKHVSEEYSEAIEAYLTILDRLPFNEPTEICSETDNGTIRMFAELVHELMDLIIVTFGLLNKLGVEPLQIFRKVMEANMNKIRYSKPRNWKPANIFDEIIKQSNNDKTK